MKPVELLKDAWEIATADLHASLRTKRAAGWALLYLVGSFLGSFGYVFAVRNLELTLLKQGRFLPSIVKEEGYRKLVEALFASGLKSYDYVLSLPPMVLYIAWISMTFLPWVLALTSYDQVAEDVERGTVRYAVLRTSRLAFVLGKFVSQTALLAVVLLLSMLAPVGLGSLYLRSFDAGATLAALFSILPLHFAYAIAFLGVISLASQLARRSTSARGLALGLLFLFALISQLDLIPKTSDIRKFVVWLRFLAPSTYKSYLFEGVAYERWLTGLLCLAMGLAFVLLGYLHFRRKSI